jgi:hypothetical protein
MLAFCLMGFTQNADAQSQPTQPCQTDRISPTANKEVYELCTRIVHMAAGHLVRDCMAEIDMFNTAHGLRQAP